MKPVLSVPILCLVTDRSLCQPIPLEEIVHSVVECGVNMVQVREKDLPGGQLLALCKRIKAATNSKALLIVNERVDVALACGADGVQLGEEALPVAEARRLVGDNMLIGRSVHSVEGAHEAQQAGADFLIVGTIFSTRSHPDTPSAGVGLLEGVSKVTRMHFLAIGGIKKNNVSQVVCTGASGVAVISAILAAENPKNEAAALYQALEVAMRSAAKARR
jgi:thiamine-phosphate pyrophosphorylase